MEKKTTTLLPPLPLPILKKEEEKLNGHSLRRKPLTCRKKSI
jgi:hypothetical protein